MRYDAFGNKTYYVNTAGTFGWNAKSQYQTDASSGLMLLGSRYYDPTIGRFISQDRARSGRNWYAYCGNNPLVAVDPSGLFPQPHMAARSPAEVLKAADDKAQAFMAALVKANTGCVIFPWNCLFPELVPAGTESSKWASFLSEMTGFEWGGIIVQLEYHAAGEDAQVVFKPSEPWIGRVQGDFSFAGHLTSATVATYHAHPTWEAINDRNRVSLNQFNRFDRAFCDARNLIGFVGSPGKTQVYSPATGRTDVIPW